MITAIKALKSHKAAGLDDILVEKVKHFGQGALTWLMIMFNHCVVSNKIPKAWRKAKINALLNHLRNREANRQLRVAWYGKHFQHVRNPIYLGVSLDRSLTCKEHSLKTNGKVESRNNT